ncbi:MAG: hypothetical protein IID55_08205 [Proteobacteria bacterium]|nr:hypothetical protein [Pseudomonadota bacterium]
MNQPFSIERPVGERETNRSDDLEAVRDALAERGLCQRTVTGQRNAKFKPDLTAGIRIFQRQAGLDPDGLVIPGGPTAMGLGLGGEAQVRAPAEAKQRSAACRKHERQIEDVQRQIRDSQREADNLQRQLDRLEPERDGLRARLENLLGPLGLGFVPSDENLAGLFRDLDNVPEEFRPEAQRASELVKKLIGLADRINDLSARLLARQATLALLSPTIARLLAQLPVVCGV